MKQLPLFEELIRLEPDCFLSGTPDIPDAPEFIEYLYPRYPLILQASVKLVLNDIPETGYHYE